jgi:hypothetical protein
MFGPTALATVNGFTHSERTSPFVALGLHQSITSYPDILLTDLVRQNSKGLKARLMFEDVCSPLMVGTPTGIEKVAVDSHDHSLAKWSTHDEIPRSPTDSSEGDKNLNEFVDEIVGPIRYNFQEKARKRSNGNHRKRKNRDQIGILENEFTK